MKPIIITAATVQELAFVIDAIGNGERVRIGNRDAYEGTVGQWSVICVVTGIGTINAASAVTALLERYEPELLINTGCAGAYEGAGLAIGDLALATAEVLGDGGVLTREGWNSLELIGIPTVSRQGETYFNRFPLCRWSAEKALHVAQGLGIRLQEGIFVTVATASGTAERGRALASRFGAICESMEGGAVAQITLLYGVDCLEIRGISNSVEDRDLGRWDIPRAVTNAQRFLLDFIQSLWRPE